MPVEVTMEGTRLEVGEQEAALLQVHERLISLADGALRGVKAAGEYRGAIALLAGHGAMSAQAVHMLCVIGRANQARATARSILETMINAYFISREPTIRAARFWAFRPIPLAKVAEARSRVFGITEGLDAIRAEAREARAKLAPYKHWADPLDIRSRAEQCGLGDVYDLYFPESSAFSHGDASVWDALSSDDGHSISLSPSANGIEDVLAPAITAGFGLLFLVADAFDRQALRDELGRLGTAFPARMKRLDLRSQFEFLRTKRSEATATAIPKGDTPTS